jgi:hypothetical protein
MEDATRRAISASLNPDDTVQTEHGRTLQVTTQVGGGKWGVVFQVRDSDGTRYALKVARDSQPATLDSIAQEPRKEALYRKYGIPHARIVESHRHYVVKEWIDGTRADEWIKAWLSQSDARDHRPIDNLRVLVHRTAAQGVYIGDLSPRNLIWDGERWVVIDSGGIKEGFAAEDALSRYCDRLPRRWSKQGRKTPLFTTLHDSLRQKEPA